ncbi:Mor transcription activator family protein [Bacillus coahuilensis]|uniref:Mor transcription activator family protein n=1 Tax=Bacillus coahuilensis TaxID=408580 RepID=UPI00031DF106
MGRKNGTRKVLRDRDRSIYCNFINGISKEQLATDYHLSIKSIERIINKEKE